MSNKQHEADEMLPEYDLSERKGVRGKYYQTVRQGYTVKIERTDGSTLIQQFIRPEGTVLLDPDVRAYFPDDEAVNSTLRALIRLVPDHKVEPLPS